jgi:archaellin
MRNISILLLLTACSSDTANSVDSGTSSSIDAARAADSPTTTSAMNSCTITVTPSAGAAGLGAQAQTHTITTTDAMQTVTGARVKATGTAPEFSNIDCGIFLNAAKSDVLDLEDFLLPKLENLALPFTVTEASVFQDMRSNVTLTYKLGTVHAWVCNAANLLPGSTAVGTFTTSITSVAVVPTDMPQLVNEYVVHGSAHGECEDLLSSPAAATLVAIDVTF